jgi:hypothetical protein
MQAILCKQGVVSMRKAFFSLIAVALVGLWSGEASAQGTALPWGQSSDMAAWETFLQITSPSGAAGSRNVEFETWASDQDIYQLKPHWPVTGEPKRLQVSALSQAHFAGGISIQTITPDQCQPPAQPPAGNFPSKPACIGEEVRRNWASYQYIVGNGLNTKAGLIAAAIKGFKVDLPEDAIEVKGDWVKVSDLLAWIPALKTPEKVREVYYTNMVTSGSTTTEYALVGLAISTKQIKNWVWATFENQMSPGRCDDIGCRDSYGAAVADVKKAASPNTYYGECVKSAAVAAMFTNAGTNPVWNNYCLKGSQITFTNLDSSPTLLGNSVVERINASVPIPRSSCITCHGYAAFNQQGDKNSAVLRVPANSPIGEVDQSMMQGWTLNDFLWGVLFAK